MVTRMACAHETGKESYYADGVRLHRCAACGLVFTDDHGKDIDTSRRYDDFYKNEIGTRFGYGIEYPIRAFRFFRALKIKTLFPRARTVLDIGSGRGWMLYYLKKYFGYTRAAGTQIAKNAVEFSRQRLGLEIYDDDLLRLPLEEESFDLVTMWHVLEHVTRPEAYIARIRELLTAGGRLIVEVPNYASWTRSLTGRYWLGLDLDHHVTFFTPASLANLLERSGFTVRTVRTFSLEYSTFLSAQSIISRLTGSDQFFFRSLLTGHRSALVVAHGLLFALIAPFCLIINLLLYYSRKGEVLLILAEKSRNLRAS